MAVILDGKQVAQSLRQSLAQQVQALIREGKPIPHLAIVLVGDDPASHTYVHNKIKACQEVGFQPTFIHEASHIQESTLLYLIHKLNEDTSIHGIIVQLPLPKHINASRIIQAIQPEKDVDGLHTFNYGRMACNLPTHIPATPLGILLLLQHYQIETAGKHCVIIGRGPTVGAPLSILMSRNAYPGNTTVTLCHSYTQQVASFTRQADILVVAIGKPGLITAGMVKPATTIIDVGITRVPDISKKCGYRLQGDVVFEEVAPLCDYITPVPGGVGPMTIAALLTNTLRAATNQVYSILHSDSQPAN
jgi:methylenetetrahydrofolate dehydrogenase (NADP+)/methenyltetrahydrofolate cyclohydrolase